MPVVFTLHAVSSRYSRLAKFGSTSANATMPEERFRLYFKPTFFRLLQLLSKSIKETHVMFVRFKSNSVNVVMRFNASVI